MSTSIVQTDNATEDQNISDDKSHSTDVTDTEKQGASPTVQPQTTTDWDGPDDPDNPHNWPLWLRVYHATTPGFFGFAVFALPLPYTTKQSTYAEQHIRHISLHPSPVRHNGRLQRLPDRSFSRHHSLHARSGLWTHHVRSPEREAR